MPKETTPSVAEQADERAVVPAAELPVPKLMEYAANVLDWAANVHRLRESPCSAQEATEFANALRAASQAASHSAQPCKRCGGTRVVDDGEIDCYPDGSPYLNGPVKCVKDCPVCTPNGRPVGASHSAPEPVAALKVAIRALEILDRRPRPMCRDCADENGTCPSSGLPCDMSAVIRNARAAASALPAFPPIKGAWIDGGYVIVTPAGTGPDKAPALRAAILAAANIEARKLVGKPSSCIDDAMETVRLIVGEDTDVLLSDEGQARVYSVLEQISLPIAAPPAPLGAESKACVSVEVEPTETETLRALIAELEAELLPYKEAETAAFLLAQRRDRAEAIAGALFPRYDSVYARRHPEERPPQWHEKSWWWNGVSVEWVDSDIDPIAPANVSLSLQSYVGGSETETITVYFPAKWLEDDNWRAPLADFVAGKTKERAAHKAAKESAEALRQIEQAKETLRRLTGDAS